jgi:hypothetical protein
MLVMVALKLNIFILQLIFRIFPIEKFFGPKIGFWRFFGQTTVELPHTSANFTRGCEV